MPSSSASLRSSQSALRVAGLAVAVVLGEEQLDDRAARRRAPRVLVWTTMPSVAGWTQEATRVVAPSTSTRQTRQAPMACTSSR